MASTITIGLDLGDRLSHFCALDAAGRVCHEGAIRTEAGALAAWASHWPAARVIIEVGTHSPWISRLLTEHHLDVIVANPRRVVAIAAATRKSDRVDAETLARLGRVDPALLAPIQHRGATAQTALAHLRARDALVRTRTLLVNHVRGSLKSVGVRLPPCTARTFATKVAPHVPPMLTPALDGVLATIESLTRTIGRYDWQLERRALQEYPETAGLRTVPGVGVLTALCYVLTIDDPTRFPVSRDAAAYLGLVPGRDQSGRRDRQCAITKTGDPMLRRFLVGAAQYILGPFGPDSDLRHWGLTLATRGGGHAKKRAVVAVARKLAILLHRLWVSGATYQPIRAMA